MPRVAGDATRHESVPLVACPSLPPPSSTQRLLCTSFARHCVPPHPCRRHLRTLGTLDLEWPCATRPHRPPLGGVNMECTNGQPAGYRRHREQSNPNAGSRDQKGANKNPLHHRGFYRPPGFPANRLTTESRRADSNRLLLLITSDHSGVAGVCRGLQIPHRQRVFYSQYCPLLQGIACGLGSSILDSYSRWTPSMGRNTAEGMNEALS
jgi:hypothetical protein